MELNKERKEKLLKILRRPELSSRRAHIFSSHYDPDSIACIWLMKLFMELFTKSAMIYLPGNPDNFIQNAEIVQKFGLSDYIYKIGQNTMKRVHPKDLVIFVDTPTPNDARFPAQMPKPHILIDHHSRPHEMEVEGESEWYWFTGCGACVSMVTKLMVELDVFSQLEEAESKKASTLGLLGILGDSKKLTSKYTTEMDYEMASFLRHYADQEKIFNISSSTYDESFLTSIGINSSSWRRFGSIMIYQMKEYCEANMPKMAEFLMMFNGIKTVFVWSLSERSIIIKARNSSQEYDLNTEIKRAFGERNGGAKDNSTGAAVVKLDFFEDYYTSDKENLLRICDNMIRKKILGGLTSI